MTNINLAKLIISDLRIWAHLGCSDQEKLHAQLVRFDIELLFNSLPQGALTDDLKDTVCYFDVVEDIKAFCAGKRFNLIEHLSYSVCKNVLEPLMSHKPYISNINISARKMSPPVEGVYGGVAFTYKI
jgi:7,8-dihydroneopterin aldolase/epimerase/oxygenase